jgi:hypothetical protein
MRREYLSPLDNWAQYRGTNLSKSALFGHDGEDIRAGLDFLEALCAELTWNFGLEAPNPYLSMAIYLVRCHLEARPATQSGRACLTRQPYGGCTIWTPWGCWNIERAAAQADASRFTPVKS